MAVKNPNSPLNRIKKSLMDRWSAGDTPVSEPRFQPTLFAKDIAIFFVLPLSTVVVFKVVEGAVSGPKSSNQVRREYSKDYKLDTARSQIIDFKNPRAGMLNFVKRAPGTLIKLRLLNTVETYANAPVHAQVIDGSLGQNWLGATLIGDASSDSNFERINITFHLVKNGFQAGLAKSIKARALSLNGTLGIDAAKKEGYFARSAFNSASSAQQSAQSEVDSMDVKHFLAKALASGLLQEFGSSSNTEKAHSQVLTLKPGTVFFAELTEYFPGDQ